MAKKSDEEKLVELLEQVTNNHWFNPTLAAHLLIQYPIYTQDRIAELVAEIVKAQATRYQLEADHNRTSAGLMLSAHLAEVVEMHKDYDK